MVFQILVPASRVLSSALRWYNIRYFILDEVNGRLDATPPGSHARLQTLDLHNIGVTAIGCVQPY
jgi:hypothetical protein